MHHYYSVKELTEGGKKRHKFKSFSERINTIDVDIFHKVDAALQEEEDTESTNEIDLKSIAKSKSWFERALHRWNEDWNWNRAFNSFFRELIPLIRSLPLLLYNKDTIINIVFKHLQHLCSTNLQAIQEGSSSSSHELLPFKPILNVSCVLGRDLRGYFSVEHLKRFVVILNDILQSTKSANDPDLVEDAFQALCYFFKFLQKPLVSSFSDFFKTYASTIMCDHREYIGEFAAQSVAFLIRKIPTEELKSQLEFILNELANSNSSDPLQYSFSYMFFEVMKGTKERFHSRTSIVLPALFSILQKQTDVDHKELIFNTLLKTLKLLASHTVREHSEPIWTCILQHLQSTIDSWNDKNDKLKVDLFMSLKLLSEWISYRKASLIYDHKQLMEMMKRVMSEGVFLHKEQAAEVIRTALSIVSVMIRCGEYEVDEFKDIFQHVFRYQSLDIIFEFTATLKDWKHLHSLMNDFILTHCDLQLDANLRHFIHFIMKVYGNADDGVQKLPLNMNLNERIHKVLKEHLTLNSRDMQSNVLLWESLRIFPLLHFDHTKFLNTLNSLYQHVSQSLHTQEDECVLSEVMKALVCVVKQAGDAALINNTYQLFIKQLKANYKSVFILRAINYMLHQFNKSAITSAQAVDKGIIDALKQNLSSPIETKRRETLSILNMLQLHHQEKHKAANSKHSNVFAVLLDTENIPKTALEGKQINSKLHEIDALLSAHLINTEYLPCVIHYLMGTLWIRLNFVWNVAIKVIATFAAENSEIFTAEFFNLLNDHKSFQSAFQSTNEDKNDVSEFVKAMREACGVNSSVDVDTHFTSMLKAIRELTNLSTAHLQHTAALFLAFIDLNLPLNKASQVQSSQPQAKLPKKKRIEQLLVFLDIFAKMKNPPKISSHLTLRQIFERLLSSSEPPVQKACLSCLLNYKEYAVLSQYKASFEKLFPEESFREQLTLINLEDIPNEHKDIYIFTLSNILYGKMIFRRGKANKLAAKRAGVVSFIAGFSAEELRHFINLLEEPFKDVIDAAKQSKSIEKFLMNAENRAAVPIPSLKKQKGLLNVLAELVQRCSLKMENYLNDIMVIVFHILHHSSSSRDADNANADLSSMCFKRLSEIFDAFNESTLIPQFVTVFLHEIEHKLDDIRTQYAQSSSSLLDCLLTLSKHYPLYSILKSNDKIISVLLSMLSPSVADAVLMQVLSFTENIIQHSAEHEEQLPSVNISSILNNLQSIMQQQDNKHASEALKSRVIGMLSTLSVHINDTEQAAAIIQLLFPSLRTKSSKQHAAHKEILKIFSNIMHLVPDNIKYLQSISLLFLRIKDRESRIALCGIFDKLSKSTPSLAPIVKLLYDLNAYNQRRLNEYDFETRTAAFTAFNEKLKENTLEKNSLLPIVYNILYYINDDEMPIRSNASYSLSLILEYIKTQQAALYAIVTEAIQPAILEGLNSKNTTARQEWITALAHLVRKFPSNFEDLQLLTSADPETDFFNNIIHIQIHRKLKALRKFQKQCEAHPFSKKSMMKVMFPIAVNLIYESKAKEQNLVDEAVKSISLIASLVSWNQYYTLLSKFIKQLTEKPNLERILIKLICNIIDNFHFTPSSSTQQQPTEQDSNTPQLNGSVAMETEATTEVTTEATSEATVEEAAKFAKIQETLTQKIIPELFLHLKDPKSQKLIRVQVAIAIIKLLKVLPEQQMNAFLPNLITSICHNLQDRSQVTRDVTRDTLNTVAETLGPTYFMFILQELKTSLTRGYQLHVLGYTLCALLKSMKKFKVGALDYCFEFMLQMLLEDIFGDVSDQKELPEIANSMKETKSVRSYDSLKTLAKIITFPYPLCDFVDSIVRFMQSIDSLKSYTKIEEILRKIALGIAANKSIQAPDLLIFIHNLISNQLQLAKSQTQPEEEEEKRGKRKRVDNFLIVPLQKKQAKNFFSSNANLFIEFGLQLFHVHLKKGFFNTKDVEQLRMLDPFIPILKELISSKFTKVVTLSLKNLCILLVLPLQSRDKNIAQISTAVFELMERRSDVLHYCLKLFTVMLKECSYYKISEAKLKALLEFIAHNLQDAQDQTITFSLLKVILKRKLLSPQIYDIMEIVCNNLVRSEIPAIRQQCSQLFLQFLLFYPIGEKRLQQHFDFILNNLEYPHETGREALLELLNQIFTKFPKEVLNQFAEYFFLPLVLRLVNDESVSCRKMAAEVLKSLLTNVDNARYERLFTLCASWYSDNSNPVLIRSAAQLLGIFIETGSQQTALSKIADLLPTILAAIPTQDADSAEDKQWELIYYTLSSIEKLLKKATWLLDSPKSYDLWKIVASKMLHQHTWVRTVCSRLLGIFFSSKDSTAFKLDVNHPFAAKDCLFTIAKNHCKQLQSDFLNNTLGTQIVKNLVFLSMLFHNNPQFNKLSSKNPFDDLKDEDEEDDDDNDEGEEVKEASNGNMNGAHKESSCIKWIFTRLSHQCKQTNNTIQKSFVLRYFAAMATQISIEPFIVQILMPLYALVENSSQNVEEQLSVLAQDVMNLIKQKLGEASFLQAYNKIRERVVKKRQKRKQAQALQASLNPEIDIAKKKQKRKKRAEAKKRKLELLQITRDKNKIKVPRHKFEE